MNAFPETHPITPTQFRVFSWIVIYSAWQRFEVVDHYQLRSFLIYSDLNSSSREIESI
jgi:hypothetical protein